MRHAELKTAFYWTCDDCCANNLVIPELQEMTEEDAEEAYRKYHQLEPWCELPDHWRDFQFIWIPATVECATCGALFSAIDEQIE